MFNWAFWRIGSIFQKIEAIYRGINTLATIFQTLLSKLEIVMSGLTDLTDAVRELNAVSDSAIALLNGLSDKIDELIAAGNNDPALATLAAELRADTAELAAAVSENTPAA